MPRLNFVEDKIVETEETNQTILDVSLKNAIPHIYACGGNARCSTCRVMILDGLENLEPRNEAEKKLSTVKGFEENIRIACQTKFKGDIKLRRLVIDQDDIEIAIKEKSSTSGREENIAILFSDIRGFTSFSEKALAYDVIHILNRYFKRMGSAILTNEGYIDKYIGDGLMALFGIHKSSPLETCLSAINSALEMIKELDKLNEYLQAHFGLKFEIGIGIHYGSVILGEVGHPEKMQFTAIGDNVNTASRIESSTKKAGVRLLVSETVYKIVESKVTRGNIFETKLKGKTGKFLLYNILKVNEDLKLCVEDIRIKIHEYILQLDAPKYIRLAFHDAGNFDKLNHTGGLNASILFELDREENAGLEPIITKIKNFKESLGEFEISFADLIALFAAESLSKLGGPFVLVEMGRKDSNQAGEKMKINSTEFTISDLIQKFSEMGFTEKELVALSGAHTVGYNSKKPFTQTPYVFDNSYFKELINSKENDQFLRTDKELLNSEITKEILKEFSENNQFFLECFKESFQKLLHLGFN
jgi:adenylate cyclase